MANSKGDLTLLATGDVFIKRENPASIFEHVTSLVKDADLAICQLEAPVSDRGGMQVHHNHSSIRHRPEIVPAIVNAGFDVCTCAGNHALDYGPEALVDNMEILNKAGLTCIGTGRNLAEARKPAFLERNGVRMAFLSYNSILLDGYNATKDKPGCAPLRAATVYEPYEPEQPGQPARILTYARGEDLENLKADVAAAKKSADLVFLSLHWGLHFVPAKLADYQKEAGHAAIDAGADMIIGHHAHILKGMEVYKGKPIFYSLANFAFDSPVTPEAFAKRMTERGDLVKHFNFGDLPAEWIAAYAFPVDSRKGAAVKVQISGGQIKRVTMVPIMINVKAQPVIQTAKDDGFRDVLNYLQWCCDDQNLGTKLRVEGDEFVVIG